MFRLGRYAWIVRDVVVRRLVAGSLVARLPLGTTALGLLLLIEERRGSFGLAGLVAGALGIVGAFMAPLLGRAVDRFGRRPILICAATVNVLCIATLLLTVDRLPAPALILLGGLLGASTPPVSMALRSLYTTLPSCTPERLPTLLAVDAIVVEVVFISGPLIVSLIASQISTAAVLICGSGLMILGISLLVSVAELANPPIADAEVSHPTLGPGIRTLMLAALPVGICFGMVQVALIGAGEDWGSEAIALQSIAMIAVGSIVGGIAFGSMAIRRPVRAYLNLLVFTPFAVLPVAAADSHLALLALAALAGLVIAPLTASESQLVGLLVPGRIVAQAYGWVIMAVALGGATGTALGGLLVDPIGWRAVAVSSAAIVGIAALAVWTRRGTLEGSLLPGSVGDLRSP